MVPDADTRADYNCNGATTVFAVPWYFLEDSHLRVLLTTVADETYVPLTLNADYTVAGAGNELGGSITTAATYSNAYRISVIPDIPYDQTTELEDGDRLPAASLERMVDKCVMLTRQLKEQVDRSVRGSENSSNDYTLPPPSIGKVLGWLDGPVLGNVPNTAADFMAMFDEISADFMATFAAVNGDTLLGTKSSLAGSVARTQHSKNEETISAFDFMTAAQIADVQAETLLVDVRAALQAAIDAAITAQKRLFLPVGNYSISAPLHVWVWSGSAFSFFSFEMCGEKHAWTNYSSNLKSTTITPTFDNLPAIMVQQARAFTLKDVQVVGLNDFSGSIGAAPGFSGLFTNSTYVVGTCRDSRYSPYAGVCIDPFGTSVPADGGYSGYSAYYVGTNAGSMKSVFENVTIQKFVTAWMLTPNGNTSNDEDVTWLSCKALYNRSTIAVGQSQSRNMNAYGLTAWFNLIALDGQTYGARQGYIPNIFGANVSFSKYLLSSSVSMNTTLGIHNLYSEALGGIGFFGATPANISNGVVFNGCSFKFLRVDNITPDYHLIGWCPIAFVGCTFTTTDQNFPLRFRNDVPNGSYKFQACNFRFGTSEATFGIHGSFRGPSYDGVSFDSCVLSMQSPSSVHAFSDRINTFTLASLNKKHVPLGAFIHTSASDSIMYRVGPTTAVNDLSLGSVTVTVSAPNATFTVADGSVVRVGDTIFNSTATNYEDYLLTASVSDSFNAIGVVTSVVGNDVTITGVPQSLVNGTYTLYKAWTPRFHTATTGDTSSGSANITNVANYAAWQVGDPIKGTGIPAGAYITNISTTTVTISKAATATNTGVRLYDANVHSFTGTAV